MEISNKTLAWLVVAAIVVSIFGTMLSLWNLNNQENVIGRVTYTNTTGSASVSVSQSVVLRFAVNSTNFGSGTVNASNNAWYCNLWVNGSVNGNDAVTQTGCAGAFSTTIPDQLVLENVGTSYLNVTLNISKNSTDFLGAVTGGAVGQQFYYVISNNESGSCLWPTGVRNVTWTNANYGVNQSVVICDNLSWAPGSNSLRIGLNITIIDNTTSQAAGAKSVTFTAQGSA